MIVNLSSGSVDTEALTPERVAKLLTILSFFDNCLEDGDSPSEGDHLTIRNLMRSVGLTPACDRDDGGLGETDGTLSTTLMQLRLQLGCPVSNDYCPETGELLIHLHHGTPPGNIARRSLELTLKQLLPGVELSMEPMPGGTTVRTGLDVDMDGCLYPISEREDD